KAMVLPSGDQAMESGGSTRLVSSAVCPESIQRTYNCGEPSAAETYAMRVPSGDQRGWLKLRASERSGRLLLPSASTIHRLRRVRSVMMSWLTRTYTMWLPSGEICTSSAYSSWNTSIECSRRASEKSAAVTDRHATTSSAATTAARIGDFIRGPLERFARTLAEPSATASVVCR